MPMQQSNNFLRSAGADAKRCTKLAQKLQPIPHCPPRRAGRSPNHTVLCRLPQDECLQLATAAHLSLKRRNLRGKGQASGPLNLTLLWLLVFLLQLLIPVLIWIKIQTFQTCLWPFNADREHFGTLKGELTGLKGQARAPSLQLSSAGPTMSTGSPSASPAILSVASSWPGGTSSLIRLGLLWLGGGLAVEDEEGRPNRLSKPRWIDVDLGLFSPFLPMEVWTVDFGLWKKNCLWPPAAAFLNLSIWIHRTRYWLHKPSVKFLAKDLGWVSRCPATTASHTAIGHCLGTHAFPKGSQGTRPA